MNERVCSALNPEVFPKYSRSLATASTQAEIAPASSGILERVVIIVVAEDAPAANIPDQRPRANKVRIGTETQSRGSPASGLFGIFIRLEGRVLGFAFPSPCSGPPGMERACYHAGDGPQPGLLGRFCFFGPGFSFEFVRLFDGLWADALEVFRDSELFQWEVRARFPVVSFGQKVSVLIVEPIKNERAGLLFDDGFESSGQGICKRAFHCGHNCGHKHSGKEG